MKERFGAFAIAMASLSLGLVGGCKSNGSAKPVRLSGAGSSFVYPLMTRWTDGFQQAHPEVQINYQSIGSGGGIEQVKRGTVDFGASDAALSDQQLGSMPPVVQIPESAGPVCITYNLADLKQPLRLSSEALAGIFLGKITSWRDPILAKDNPGMVIPDEKIMVVHRAEGSGTTAIFTTYLAAVSPEWNQSVGMSTAVKWPIGLGGKGSEGVTGQIRLTPGAIGYVELIYATQNKLPIASMKNLAGQYVAPSATSTTAAIAAFRDQLAKDPRVPIVNPPASAPGAYPIAGLTFLLLPKDGPDQIERTQLRSFIQYIITDGQALAGTLGYAPLPDAVKQYDQQALAQLTVGGQPLP